MALDLTRAQGATIRAVKQVVVVDAAAVVASQANADADGYTRNNNEYSSDEFVDVTGGPWFTLDVDGLDDGVPLG